MHDDRCLRRARSVAGLYSSPQTSHFGFPIYDPPPAVYDLDSPLKRPHKSFLSRSECRRRKRGELIHRVAGSRIGG